jgi:chemotaxis protein methyltransferase CheR
MLPSVMVYVPNVLKKYFPVIPVSIKHDFFCRQENFLPCYYKGLLIVDRHISEKLLERLNNFVHKKTGLYFPENRRDDLKRAITACIEESDDTDLFIESLLSSTGITESLNSLIIKLTVGETYFFRDRKVFDLLEEKILPDLIDIRKDGRKYLKIWSAGCSTGEEPYSIAIVLNKIIKNLQEWDIKILATDINRSSLEKAKAGIYKEWSFRDTPLWVKDGYFTKTDKKAFSVKPDIKQLITFSWLNLVEDTYPAILNKTTEMDIIFCRNVLMYFSAEVRKKIVSRLYSSLVDGGWFFISPSEASCLDSSPFIPVNLQGAILYKKDVKERDKNFYNRTFPINDRATLQNLWQPEIFPQAPLYNLFTDKSKIPLEQINLKPSEAPDVTEYELSLKFYAEGKYTEAAQKLEELFNKGEIASSDSKSMIILAKSYANQKKFSHAEDWCKKAIVQEKTNQNYYYLLSSILQEENKIEDAIISLKKAIYLDENFVLSYFSLGNLYLKQGKKKDAEKQFKNALSILDTVKKDEVLQESDGITAGRLEEIIKMMV